MYSDRLFYCNSYCGDMESGKGSYIQWSSASIAQWGEREGHCQSTKMYLLVPRCDYISSFLILIRMYLPSLYTPIKKYVFSLVKHRYWYADRAGTQSQFTNHSLSNIPDPWTRE